MNYRISYYDTTLLSLKKWRDQDGECTETFATEHLKISAQTFSRFMTSAPVIQVPSKTCTNFSKSSSSLFVGLL